MISLRKSIQNTFSAIAFAEHGEHETARQLLGVAPPRQSKLLATLRRTFAAVAFAEEGMPELALEMAGLERPRAAHRGQTLEQFLREVGLNGVPAYIGVAQV